MGLFRSLISKLGSIRQIDPAVDLLVVNTMLVIPGSVDPTAGAGVAALQPALYFRTSAGVSTLYLKTGAADTAWTLLGSGSAASAAMFYGTTSGTGSEGNDYSATVAVGTAVPFPRDGSTSGGQIVRDGASTTDFEVLTTGQYRITWAVAFNEISQLQVAVNGTGVARTCTTSGAGTQINSNSVLLDLAANDIISILNPVGNSTALTVQPADGALTHAQAPSLVIELIA